MLLALTGAVAVCILLAAAYARTRYELRQRTEQIQQLQRRQADLQALDRLTTQIQSSRTVESVSEAVLSFARDAFPDSAGTVAMRSTGQEFEVVATWGAGLGTVDRTGYCYAVRDNKMFSSDGASQGFRCQHVEGTYVGPYMCFPIPGQAVTGGVLHLRFPVIADAEEHDRRRTVGEVAASRIGVGVETLKLHDLLRAQSLVDPLTGLNNRRALFDHARRVHSQAVYEGRAYSVIIADIDRFKALNDTLGHSAGDAVLVTFARHIQRHVRSQDFACRYGGEEFVVVMPDATREVAWQRAESMRATLGSLRTSVPATVWRLSASFGVATFPFDANRFPEVLRRADEAMYQAKSAGRDRVASWSPRLRQA
jgi:diguanylate cyclase (GGDEF)-like protein